MILKNWYRLNEDKTVTPLKEGDYYPVYEQEQRRVALTKLKDNLVTVSTVFLGLDHSWDADPPLLFETMVFGGEHSELMYRYSTYQQAEQGHNLVVEALEKGIHPQELLKDL
jgi:hypothetical protein